MNLGWDARIVDDDDIRAYFRTRWPAEYSEMLEALPLPVMKADLWRYAVLYTHGGVYADADSRCRVPVDDWARDEGVLTGDVLLVAAEGHGGDFFCQWAMLGTKRHPALLHVMRHILSNWRQNGTPLADPEFVHRTTGPAIWTAAIASYLGLPPGSKAAEIVASYASNRTEALRVNRAGVYLLGHPHFAGELVENGWGSFGNMGPGYPNWHQQREALLARAAPTEPAARVQTKG
jgi:hypothetical protein